MEYVYSSRAATVALGIYRRRARTNQSNICQKKVFEYNTNIFFDKKLYFIIISRTMNKLYNTQYMLLRLVRARSTVRTQRYRSTRLRIPWSVVFCQ